ncbi:MAG: chemotaxis protein CheD [Tissierellales bacterium]|nr:chemotaxis protein CheD [Tissierellales bacterium]
MVETIKVGISDYKISTSPNILMTLGLGSCVGIAIYDSINKVGGLSHILLPDSTSFSRNVKEEKFANLAIPKMVKELKTKYASTNLTAKIAGGASMFEFTFKGIENGIGEQNVIAVKRILNELGIPIIAAHTGGSSGRTMIVDLSDFTVTIKSANSETITI